MKNSTRFFIVSSLSTMLAFYGCSVPSSEVEMNEAQQAMDNAKGYHAESLAASDWDSAMQAWEEAQAAVKEGKPAKNLFLRSKSRFEKTTAIAKSKGEVMSRDVTQIQLSINERLSKIKSDIVRGRLSSRIQRQIDPVVSEVDQGVQSVEALVSDKDFVKAKILARELQAKISDIELIMAGKKPAS